MSNSAPNPSLQKKTAARTAAIQILYQVAMTDEEQTTAERIKGLKARLKDNREEQKLLTGMGVEPDYALLSRLLDAIAQFQGDIDARLDESLGAKWTRERMSKLLVAILRAAICELFFGKDVKPAIVIDEYTRLTRSFLTDPEADFVFGALSKLAQRYAA